MKAITPYEWKPEGGLSLEDAAMSAIQSTRNVLVTAGPGAGKTELLAQKACFLLQTNVCRNPHRILAISFKRDEASNLKDRVVLRCGDCAKMRFMSLTYDAFAKLLLDRFMFVLPQAERPSRAYELTGYPAQGAKRPDGHLILTFIQVRELAIRIVSVNKMVRQVIRNTFSHIFLDEFQDTTRQQYQLINACFEGYERGITAVGDEKQRIMVWAGAVKNIFDQFENDYRAEKMSLIRNFRSAPRLIAFQESMYGILKTPEMKIKASEKWGSEDGRIVLFESETENAEAEAVADDIKKRIAEGIMPRDICILSKNRPAEYAKRLMGELEKRNVQAREEAKYQDLVKQPCVRLVVEYLKYLSKRRDTIDIDYMLPIYAVQQGFNLDDDDQYMECLESLAHTRTAHRITDTKINSKLTFNVVLKEIVGIFGDTVGIKRYFPEYGTGRLLEETLNQFSSLFVDILVRNEWDVAQAVSDFYGDNSIPIMTVHKSKGLEYKCVYFIGLDDEAFFNFAKEAEEDRCVFFVAMSRAKEYLAFTYSHNRLNSARSRRKINEFYELLKSPGVADVINVGANGIRGPLC